MTEHYQRRENAKVEIVDFRSEHADAFRQMNLDWITLYWEVEDADRLYLDNPREKILKPGGIYHVFKDIPHLDVPCIYIDDGSPSEEDPYQ